MKTLVLFGDPRVPARVWDKMRVEQETGCWRWLGSIAGGAQVRVRGATVQVKRFLYEAANGPTRSRCVGGCAEDCVNPEHQVAGTMQAIQAAYTAKRATCKRGHLRAEVGEYAYRKCGKNYRHCRACTLEQQRAYQARRRKGRKKT